MKLFLISQNVNIDYDTFTSAVVAAETADDARSMHPGGEDLWKTRGGDTTWTSPDQVDVKEIGIANEGVTGVVCAAFRAA